VTAARQLFQKPLVCLSRQLASKAIFITNFERRLFPLKNEKDLPYPLEFLLLAITAVILSFPVLLLADDSGLPLSVVETTSPIIVDIVFQGNKVTRPRTMIQEMVLSKGDPADPEKVELSRQAIMDLNLFKSAVIEQHKKRAVQTGRNTRYSRPHS